MWLRLTREDSFDLNYDKMTYKIDCVSILNNKCSMYSDSFTVTFENTKNVIPKTLKLNLRQFFLISGILSSLVFTT